MWRQSAFCREKHNKSKVSAILEEKWMRVSMFPQSDDISGGLLQGIGFGE